ncbi:MAG: response regulator [Helicobacteraceae bacterium]|nr:response regulator [Helicobacteraceae bacterium]
MYNILIVDDTLKNIQLASTILKQEGYKIVFATSGEQAIERLNGHDFDTILLDIMMPGIDGYETATIIKNDENTEEIPIIFLTANADQDSIVKGFESGASDYISKPFNPVELKLRVKTQCELFNAKKQIKEQLDDNLTLLKQYKKMVDEGSIVSKTDLSGKITYVNDKFIAISGYAKEELLGEPHNIVRHDAAQESIYKDMWQKISNQKCWRGIIKNRKKNGDTYVVNSSIMPILDKDNNTQEYMSIRTDITEAYELKEEIQSTQKEIISRFGEAIESRSKETGAHVKRVAEYSYMMATLCGLSESEAQLLKNSSPMHDIGKIAIPDHVLLKAGKLTSEEFDIIKTHPEIGYEILKTSERPMLRTAAIVSQQHHEKWDGSGYPSGLKGEDIHIYGRITAIADVFDALGHERVYKKAWPEEKIISLFKEERGKHFDPNLVDLFLDNIDTVREIQNKCSAL